ncbi:MAG: hypothetical protein IMZ66_02180, partial [Planctomycetes bacterium]|nr:hypothetical protein [Planctomycetota bacterium]
MDESKTTSPAADDAGELIDRVLRILCRVPDAAQAARVCAATLGLSGEALDAALRAARERLTRAAAVHRDEELVKAIARLNACYEKAMTEGGIHAAIAAQRELNRLLALGPSAEPLTEMFRPAGPTPAGETAPAPAGETAGEVAAGPAPDPEA